MTVRFVAVCCCLAMSSPVPAAQCYYWMADDGSVTSYQRPPVPLSSRSLDGTPGRWMIYEAERCQDGRVIKEAEERTRSAPDDDRTESAALETHEPQPLAVTPLQAQIDRQQAIDLVLSEQARNHTTVEDAFREKVANPAVKDLGWNVEEHPDGYVVERELQIGGLLPTTIYRWKVALDGSSVEPTNGYSAGLTRTD